MNRTLACALFVFLFLGAPVYAQTSCVDCLKAAQDELKKCVENAISQEDKKSCAEKQEARSKVCENGACEVERHKSNQGNDVTPQKK